MNKNKQVEGNITEKAMKRNKIINIVVNVVVAVIAIFVVFLASSAIASTKTGYTNLFGYAGVSVLTNSMEGENEDSFNKGDMIFIKLLKDEEKTKLEVNDVITFYTIIDGKQALNTHRIIEVVNDNNGVSYITRGDNAKDANNDGQLDADPLAVSSSGVIGVYEGSRLPGFGSVALFLKGPIGFGIFVVLPSIALLGYAIYKVIIAVKQVKDEEKMDNLSVEDLNEEQKAKLLAKEKERLKAELLAELNAEKEIVADVDEKEEPSEEELETPAEANIEEISEEEKTEETAEEEKELPEEE